MGSSVDKGTDTRYAEENEDGDGMGYVALCTSSPGRSIWFIG